MKLWGFHKTINSSLSFFLRSVHAWCHFKSDFEHEKKYAMVINVAQKKILFLNSTTFPYVIPISKATKKERGKQLL